ncbi:hypothetical protein QJS66_14655 [Kocuria rhizophila]|nr:hypothetical protein QJS66_14655 [Kocuria rhizophila]
MNLAGTLDRARRPAPATPASPSTTWASTSAPCRLPAAHASRGAPGLPRLLRHRRLRPRLAWCSTPHPQACRILRWPPPRSQYGKWIGIALGFVVVVLVLLFTGSSTPATCPARALIAVAAIACSPSC